MKILLLANQNVDSPGGVEKYNSKLLEIFKKSNHQCDLLIFSNDKKISKFYEKFNERKNYISSAYNLFMYRLYSRRKIRDINIKKYDLIIDSTYIFFHSLYKNNKYLWVQHSCPNFYKGKVFDNKIANLIYILYQKICLVGNFFKSKNIVVFDNYNVTKQQNNQMVFDCPLSCFNENEIKHYIKDKNPNKIAYIGRYVQNPKNISLLKDCNIEIHCFGDGPDKDIIDSSSNLINHGMFSHNDLKKIFRDVKLLLLPSKYEGFPFSIVEALSLSTPVLIMDSFPSAKTLAINKDFLCVNDKDFINKLQILLNKNSNEYYRYYNDAKTIALENLTEENFISKWQAILKNFSNNTYNKNLQE